MNRLGLTLAGLIVLAGCDGGGGSTPVASQPPPTVQPDMLTATPQGLLRGKASGQEQRLILAKSNLHQSSIIVVSQPHVFYTTRTPDDIWTVHTDGTGDRAVLNTTHAEFIATVNGPWMIYGQDVQQPSGRFVTHYGSVNIETGAQFMFDDPEGTDYQPQNASRLISTTSRQQISSVTVTGTDRITYASVTPEEQQIGVLLGTPRMVGNALTYSRSASIAPATFYSRTYAVPLAGGTAVLLDEERYDTYSAWSIGDRVVYHRCGNFSAHCDVVSIQTNGTNRVVLTSNPANEAVQGVATTHVIIRRNLNGNDHLIAVPVTGGAERLLMTMADSEFAQLTLDDLVIVSRSSGTWKVDLNGTLTQLGTVALDFGVLEVGQAVCGNRGDEVWCMPLDGQGQAVKIADEGKVIGAL